MSEDEFLTLAHTNPVNAALLQRLPSLGLADCYLVAGCLFQAAWNRVSGRAPEWGVKDYDVFYFDDSDLSWDAEDQVIRRVAAATSDLPGTVEVRNQARVHLWYGEHFGEDYPALTCARDGIDRYLISCTCVGIEVATGRLYAPNGFDDLAAGMLRMNPLNAIPRLFQEKAESYRARWPWLSIVE
jgi:hypothetical protein